MVLYTTTSILLSILRDWQIFGHGSDFPTWSEGQIVRQKCQIFGETLNPHISGLERAFDKIPKPKINYLEVPNSI